MTRVGKSVQQDVFVVVEDNIYDADGTPITKDFFIEHSYFSVPKLTREIFEVNLIGKLESKFEKLIKSLFIEKKEETVDGIRHAGTQRTITGTWRCKIEVNISLHPFIIKELLGNKNKDILMFYSDAYNDNFVIIEFTLNYKD